MVSHDGMEDYTLESELGHGAFGVAFLALRNSDRRQCVVKRIKMREMSKRDALAAEREVTVMQKVAHPNIIGYYDSFVSQENMHIVMEYADGGTLYTVLRSALHTGPLAESSVLAYFAQLLAAVRCLHQNHILHRDLKSPNVFLTSDNMVKLGDFGLSRVLASNSFAKSTVGTVPQLSPELCKGKPYGTECDVWALGCLLYEMTHRRNAFKEHSLPATVMKIMRGDFALDATQPYSDAIVRIIEGCLEVSTERRSTLDELVRHPLLHPLVDSLDADYAAAGNLSAGRTEPTQPTPVTSQERGGGWVRGSVDFVPIAGSTDDPSPEAAGTEPPPTPANAAAGRRRGGGGGRRAAARSIGALTEVGDSMQSLPKTPGGEHGACRRRFSRDASLTPMALCLQAWRRWAAPARSGAPLSTPPPTTSTSTSRSSRSSRRGKGLGGSGRASFRWPDSQRGTTAGARHLARRCERRCPPLPLRPACGATCVTVPGLCRQVNDWQNAPISPVEAAQVLETSRELGESADSLPELQVSARPCTRQCSLGRVLHTAGWGCLVCRGGSRPLEPPTCPAHSLAPKARYRQPSCPGVLLSTLLPMPCTPRVAPIDATQAL